MKAYNVFIGDPIDGCLLVFAKTRGKAKMMWWDVWDFIDISAIRMKEYDKFIKDDTRRAIETNEDLLKYAPDAPLFYLEDYWA